MLSRALVKGRGKMLEIKQKLTKINRTIANNRKIEYIVIHYVGAVSSAKNNVDYFYDKDRKSSAHYFVDEKSIWQCVEDKNIAWHCGGAKKYYSECRNSNSIGIELCCKKDDSGKLYFEEQTLKNALELVRYLMKLYKIKSGKIIRHYDVTRKVCPKPFVIDDIAWQNFKGGLEMKEFTDVDEALKYLVEKGRMTNEEYWRKAVAVVRNLDALIMKWANDVEKIQE